MGMEAEVVPILLMVPDWWQGCDLIFALSVSDFFALLAPALEWIQQGGAVSHPRPLSAASQPRPVVFIRGDWRWSTLYHQHHVGSLLVGHDGTEQALGDGIIAESLGQEQSHRAGIDGVTKHAAAHAGFGLDDSHGFLMHSKEPMS